MADIEKLHVSASRGLVPNDTYSIEYVNGEYKARRGYGNPYYLETRLTSRDEAINVIQKDAESNGASGVNIRAW
jgi:hypothetical protein